MAVTRNAFHLPRRYVDPGRRKHVAGVEDYQVALATFLATCRRWPGTAITLRQGAGVIEDSRRLRVVGLAVQEMHSLSELTKELGESDAAGGCGGRKQSEMGLRSRRHLAFCKCRRGYYLGNAPIFKAMVFGIRLSIGTVGEQADNLEATARAVAYQDCHEHFANYPHEQHARFRPRLLGPLSQVTLRIAH